MTRYAQRTLIQQPTISNWGKSAPAGGIGVVDGYGVATGGIGAPTSVTISNVNYQYLEFQTTGTLTVTTAGLFDILSFGGGGSGGNIGAAGTTARGGGGAGGKQQTTIYIDANTTITIGAAGSGANAALHTGTATTIGTLLSVPGGGGGFYDTSSDRSSAENGGSCGGQNSFGVSLNPTQTAFAGNVGGGGSTQTGGGGGGGAGAVGATAVGTTGGAGGAGFDVSAFIGGSARFIAGGGGGGGTVASGAGGSSIGGAGGAVTAVGSNAVANTASGGGGAADSGTATRVGGNGSAGLVFVRFKV